MSNRVITDLNLLELIEEYVKREKLLKELKVDRVSRVSFLAQGEYNLNFLLESGSKKFVLRLNTGSQMHLNNQIRYEFTALEALKDTGVTPVPLFIDDSCDILPLGMLVMEYLPGRSLVYEKDIIKAARIFAQIHQLPVKDDIELIYEESPLSGIWNECQDMIQLYLDSPSGEDEIKHFISGLRNKLEKKMYLETDILNLLPLSIVNTEVNSGNFIIDSETGQSFLIDWEKPLITTPLQDLSHFVVPTTTLWKTDYQMQNVDRDLFLKTYCQERGRAEFLSEIKEALIIFDQFSAYRGISWSAMAWVEYQRPNRLLKNEDTFNKIENYLKIDFLKSLFSQI
ncbi:MAG: aminoglycoside phosphotransferase family protein [Firmicutes bacterium]|nr:aminoglycoside phosphotransferase family protein [Bacillota bacterium]